MLLTFGCREAPPDSIAPPETGVYTGSTPTTAPFDCSTVPDLPSEPLVIEGARGYHDLAFDRAGNVVGAYGITLVRSTRAGQSEVLLSGVGSVEGMGMLPTGDLVFVESEGPVVRITAEGGRDVLGYMPLGYGLTVGPDARVWVADRHRIDRFDPDTYEQTTILADAGFGPQTLDFSPDGRTLYIGTIDSQGGVWALPLGDDFDPAGPPVLFSRVGNGPLHDGLGVDVCGHVWVIDYEPPTLSRISPDGVARTVLVFERVEYGHGLAWGSGVGGWRADAVYLPMPYVDNIVQELVIGVPSREWSGGALTPE